MDLRIGVSQTAKELDIELPEGTDPDKLKAEIDKSLAGEGTLWVTDRKGRQVGVPASKVAYVELGSPDDARRIGFGG